MRVHPESGVVLSDKGDYPLLWDDPPSGDGVAAFMDREIMARAWQMIGILGPGEENANFISITAGLQSAWLRFHFPLRDKNIPLEQIADTMRAGILEMMQQLERVELVGWGAPAMDRTDGRA